MCHFETLPAVHTFSYAPERLIACTAVIYSGLLEQCPTLRVAFLEAGAGWVPFWMEPMAGEWSKRKFDAPLPKVPPSEYMRCGRVFISCAPEEIPLYKVPLPGVDKDGQPVWDVDDGDSQSLQGGKEYEVVSLSGRAKGQLWDSGGR